MSVLPGTAAAAMPDICVVVPHYNDLARLDLCLAALERQTVPRGRFEIVVADNMSPCGLAAVEQVIAGRARLAACAERGAGPTRNTGVAATQCPLLAFTDSDCVPAPDWLAQGVAALSNADVVGGEMVVTVRVAGQRSGAEAFEQLFAFDNRRYVERLGFTVTANLFTRRAVFGAVGGFRTQVSEDAEWCARATAQGFSLSYAAGAVVAHPARENWEQLLNKWRRMQQERFCLMAGQPWGRVRWWLRSLALPFSAVAHAPRVLLSAGLDSWGERWRALGTLFAVRLWRFADAQRLMIGRR
ncbi:MAG: glycosyltransferase [Sphingomonas sp.]